jgi:hypothetical protein
MSPYASTFIMNGNGGIQNFVKEYSSIVRVNVPDFYKRKMDISDFK